MNRFDTLLETLRHPRATLGLFIAVAALQLSIPAYLIIDRELALHRGERLVLAVGPVDPLDLVRGRFVALRYVHDSLVIPPGHGWKEGDTAYVTYALSNGIHIPSALMNGAPREAHVKVEISGVEPMVTEPEKPVTHSRPNRNLRRVSRPAKSMVGDTIRFTIPLNRFYMEESKAPEMEKKVREGARDDVPARAYLRVRGNTAVLETVIPGSEKSEPAGDL